MPDSDDLPPDGSEDFPSGNAAEQLDALSRSNRPIVFFRVAGGQGPGWSGDTYMGEQCAIGWAGEFQGDSLDVIVRQLTERCGGGAYSWSGVDSKGKPKRSQVPIMIAGRPKPLPGDDPAAHDQRARADAYREQEAGSPRGGARGYGIAPQVDDEMRARALNNKWVWVPEMQQYEWITFDGSPPLFAPPKHAPGAQRGGYGYSSPPQEPESELFKLLKKQDERLERLEKERAEKGGGSMMEFMMNSMNLAHQREIAAAAQARADAESRWTREQAAAKAEREERRELEKERMRIQERSLELSAGAKPKGLKESLEELALLQDLKNDGKEDEEEEKEADTIGKKVVSTLENFSSFAKDWYTDKREKDKQNPPPPKTQQRPQNGNGGGQQQQAQTQQQEGGDELASWIPILEHVEDCYQNGYSPEHTMGGVVGVCRGLHVDPDLVVLQMKKFSSSEELMGLLSLAPGNYKAQLDSVAKTFSSAAGKAWFDQLLAHVHSLGKA